MISTTMGIQYNQITNSIKIESKKVISKNTPYFFTTIKTNKNTKINSSKKIENKKK